MRVLLVTDTAEDLLPPIKLGDRLDEVSPRQDVHTLRSIMNSQRITFETLAGATPWQIAGIAHAHEIEAIHALGKVAAQHVAIAGRLVGIPTLATIYEPAKRLLTSGIEEWLVHLPALMKQTIDRQIMGRGIDQIIAPTDLIRRDLIRASYPASRITVIYSGVDMETPVVPVDRGAMGLRDDAPLVAMIGDGDPGIEILLRVLPKLKMRIPDAQIVIVGGVARDLLQRTNPALPLRWMPRADNLRGLIAASDVVVHHTSREGVPRAIMQAAAAGKPVVCSRVPGIVEIVKEGVTGLLVTPGDLNDFVIQIGRVLTQPRFAGALGHAAREMALAKFSYLAQSEATTITYEATIYASR
ncbi:MAG TPA: glycosyltransferase family 4 protein [Aggregatilineales bacterium]|nr:glycosyltransferase family 4 protein [Aggregatilineales bacterium]